MSQSSRVAVIGAGVMGEALIAALISSGIPADQITISEKREDRAQELVAKYSVTAASLQQSVADSGVLLLVVKPQDMSAVLAEIKSVGNSDALVISFAAGKTISFIRDGLASNNPVIRVMPNTPALVSKGMAAVSMGSGVSPAQREFVLSFLGATGTVIEVNEELQDAVTATSGSGPAYFFAFVEAMIAGATELGLSHEDATILTLQTIIGAAALLDQSGQSATTLRENVTSPNGTTAAALASFTSDGLQVIVAKAMKAARDRSQELG